MTYYKAPITLRNLVGSDIGSPSNLDSLEPELIGELIGLAQSIFVRRRRSYIYILTLKDREMYESDELRFQGKIVGAQGVS